MTDEEAVIDRMNGGKREVISGQKVVSMNSKGSKYDQNSLFGKLEDGREFRIPMSTVKQMIGEFVFDTNQPVRYVILENVNWVETDKLRRESTPEEV